MWVLEFLYVLQFSTLYLQYTTTSPQLQYTMAEENNPLDEFKRLLAATNEVINEQIPRLEGALEEQHMLRSYSVLRGYMDALENRCILHKSAAEDCSTKLEEERKRTQGERERADAAEARIKELEQQLQSSPKYGKSPSRLPRPIKPALTQARPPIWPILTSTPTTPVATTTTPAAAMITPLATRRSAAVAEQGEEPIRSSSPLKTSRKGPKGHHTEPIDVKIKDMEGSGMQDTAIKMVEDVMDKVEKRHKDYPKKFDAHVQDAQSEQKKCVYTAVVNRVASEPPKEDKGCSRCRLYGRDCVICKGNGWLFVRRFVSEE